MPKPKPAHSEQETQVRVAPRSPPATRKSRAPRVRKTAALAVSAPAPLTLAKSVFKPALLKPVLAGAAVVLVGGLIFRIATRRRGDAIDTAIRGLFALATAWTA